MIKQEISIVGAKVHNLKNVSLEIPKNKLVVFTGLSGSGKSSLAFDTIYAEGQRRYIESLSAYARQFLGKLDKPDVEQIEGLSPAISIDQKSASHNPRSTVGTVTEIYDYLRLLYASVGIPHCSECGKVVESQSPQEIVDHLFKKHGLDEAVQFVIMAPLVKEKKGEHKDLFEKVKKEGFSRVRVDGKIARISDEINLDKKKKHTIEIVVDRLSVNEENRARLFESVETALGQGLGLVLVQDTENNEETVYSEMFACPDCNIGFAEISPRLFSFNSPVGACKNCNGLGEKLDFDSDLVIEFPQEAIRQCTGKIINLDASFTSQWVNRTIVPYGFDIDTRYCDLTEEQKNILLYGTSEEVEENPYITGDGVPDYEGVYGNFEGIITNLRRRFFQTKSEGMRFFFRSYMSSKTCDVCLGQRLKKEALAVLVANKNITELTGMSVKNLISFFDNLKFTQKEEEIAKQILKEIKERLGFLFNVGLEYITLIRKSDTLSGGEFQRIRLATQIGSGLTGVLYVLDEPSIGLHQKDNQKLIEALIRLKDLGNTLIVVEHDEETMKRAEHIVDIGPGAGRHGGEIVFSGSYEELLKSDRSLTAQYLNGKKAIEVPLKRRKGNGDKLVLKGARENNLKNLDVKFPLGNLVCVTGVSGSGKSSLIQDILYPAMMKFFYKSKPRPGKHDSIEGLEHIDNVITIDQSPIGRTPRSNPATYVGVFTAIRELFTATKEAKIRGYKAGRFSFNVKGGRCEACEGDGLIKIEMHFLSDVYVTCDVCKGKRYNEQTLEVKYKGNTISDVLKMTVSEAQEAFENIPQINKKLITLQDVGLGYIHLGQSATTLSGGEAQRIKLAKELSKRSTGKTLYLLDEPTTGLHFEDIRKLLSVLDRLVNAGNTIIVIEHNLDVIKTADHIIDLGPEGGDKGGQIVACGTPEDVAKVKASFTGQYLKSVLTK
jgi:excinuclease ABC subunit A